MAIRNDTTLTTEAEQLMATELATSFDGEVIDRRHPSYEDARQVWNGIIDRRPALIARCASTADVVEALRVARWFRPVVSIRGGGHQVAGSAVCDDALVIDLSAMKGVQVEPTERVARAQGGVLWGELDRATQLHGLITPGGEMSRTGIAGLTLGGGVTATMRAYGLACDTLRSIEIVTADGMVRTASRDEHADLFWAARGGGRGIGVITSFTYDLHPLGPDVASAMFIYPYDDAAAVIRAFADVAPGLPDEVGPELLVITVPPAPDFPEELHGQRVVIVAAMYAGPTADGHGALEPLGQLGTPLGGEITNAPYLELQSTFDPMFPDGGRYYMKSHFMDHISDDAIDALLRSDAARPEADVLIALRTMGGAVARVDAEESAFAHRNAAFNLSIDPHWSDPGLDDETIGWARGAWDGLQPYANGGVYLNFSGLDDDVDALRSAVQGSTTDRLAEIRRSYDPEGILEPAAQRP
jgi:FAD/FMN-containing dehydrogenase